MQKKSIYHMRFKWSDFTTAVVFGAVLLMTTVLIVIVPPIVWRDLNIISLIGYVFFMLTLWFLAIPALAYLSRDSLKRPWWQFSIAWVATTVVIAVLVLLTIFYTHKRKKDRKPKRLTVDVFIEHVKAGNRYDTWRQKSRTIFFVWLGALIFSAAIWHIFVSRIPITEWWNNPSWEGDSGRKVLICALLFVIFVVTFTFVSANPRYGRTLIINYQASDPKHFVKLEEEYNRTKYLKKYNIDVQFIRYKFTDDPVGCEVESPNAATNATKCYKYVPAKKVPVVAPASNRNFTIWGTPVSVWITGLMEDLTFGKASITYPDNPQDPLIYTDEMKSLEDLLNGVRSA
jgi:hypothetical protein